MAVALDRFYSSAESADVAFVQLRSASALQDILEKGVRELGAIRLIDSLVGISGDSRDCDLVILADDENFNNLQRALDDLQADCIAVPEFKAEYLQCGHAVHFRCQHPDVSGLRIDVMSVLRGCDSFEQLWARRTTIQDPDANFAYEVLAIEDLVQAKKTQRDKDWPMIGRLVEARYDLN